jgi:enterochelin esterase-like enzyme
MDKNYRTIPNAESTTIIGSSHGGLCAFLVGMLHADKFGIIGSYSPSFWAGLGVISTLSGIQALESSALLEIDVIKKTLTSQNKLEPY